MTHEEKKTVKFVEWHLDQLDYGDIVRALHGKSQMGAFILSSCLIDHLAYFYSPIGTEDSKSGKRFTQFASQYLPSYDAVRLYKALRCRLVHNYTEGGSYQFVCDQKARHLTQDTDTGRTFLNLQDFMSDLREAMNRFFSDALSGQTVEDEKGAHVPISDNIVMRFNKTGILGVSRRHLLRP
jgi:hypothetical protein